jgi:hypothetical protein
MGFGAGLLDWPPLTQSRHGTLNAIELIRGAVVELRGDAAGFGKQYQHAGPLYDWTDNRVPSVAGPLKEVELAVRQLRESLMPEVSQPAGKNPTPAAGPGTQQPQADRPPAEPTPTTEQTASNPPPVGSAASTPFEETTGLDLATLTSEAKALWERGPVRAFEELRDHVVAAINIVVAVHQQARKAQPNAILSQIAREHLDPLLSAVCRAQAIWHETPVTRYLTRTEGPVHLDYLGEGAVGRVSGSCHHDLALAVAVGLLEWLKTNLTARDYTAAMRFHTAAGDFVGQRFANLAVSVKCECQAGIKRWQTEQGNNAGTCRPAETPAPPLDAADSTDSAAGPASPYHVLADVLRDLWRLVAEPRRDNRDCLSQIARLNQIDPLTQPWEAAEQLARSASPAHGIPFEAFDPVLTQAHDMLEELLRVAAGNESASFNSTDARWSKIDRRLRELGATYARGSLDARQAVAPAQPANDNNDVPRVPAVETQTTVPPSVELKYIHNADFTMVKWGDTEYHFALGVQSSAVRALWGEWERTGLGLHQETIREAIDAERDSFRMDTAFRKHPAFGTMIQRCGDGRYKLAPCAPEPAPSGPKVKRITRSAPKSRRKRP